MQNYVLDSIANNAGIKSFGIISIQGLSAPVQVEPGTPFDVLYSARNDSTTTQTVFGYIWDITLQQQIIGSYWETQVAASQSYSSTNHFTGITTAFSGEVRVGHSMGCAEWTTQTDCVNNGCYWYAGSCHSDAPACSPEDILQCQGFDLYKCVNGNWVLQQTNATQCGYIPPVCTDSQTKCEGTTKYTCVGGQWANPVPNSTDCGYVEPCSPENALRCEGFDLFKCLNGIWTKIETNSSVCGYVPPECTNGTTKCIGKDKYTCVNGFWVLSEANSSDCESIWTQPWVIPAAVVGAGSIIGIALLLVRRK